MWPNESIIIGILSAGMASPGKIFTYKPWELYRGNYVSHILPATKHIQQERMQLRS